MYESWDDLHATRMRLEVDLVTDLSVSSFAFLPRQIIVACCFQLTSTPGVVRYVSNVCFELVFPVVDDCFIYSTGDKANSIIFNGSTVEFDFSTFVREQPRTHIDSL